jgi:integrase/recombinase XerD
MINTIGPMQDDIERSIHEWCNATFQRSNSQGTIEKYLHYMLSFRLALQRAGFDVASSPREIKRIAEIWASTTNSQHRTHVSPATYNFRLSIVSSWYQYAVRHDILDANPIEKIERSKNSTTQAAKGFSTGQFIESFKSIGLDTPTKRRNSALIAVAACTGLRVTELSSMTIGDITIGEEKYHIFIKRIKGGEQVTVDVVQPFLQYLILYLVETYGEDWQRQPPAMPIWTTLSQSYFGKKMSNHAIAEVVEKIFGSSRCHTLRKTSAQLLLESGMPVEQVQVHLHHKKIETTMKYIIAGKPDIGTAFSGLIDKIGIQEEKEAE